MYSNSNFPSPLPNPVIEHYYGDAVRRFFVMGGVIMIATLPFFVDLLPVKSYVALFAILVVSFFAGLMNPKQGWVAVMNLLISVIAFSVFEYHAAATYLNGASERAVWFMWVNQILAFNFFLATYFASKTIRGMYLKKGELLRRRGDAND